jgi:putative FmdB family regulatory protein
MPIYEYQCDNCGKTEEAIQKFSDAPLTSCSNCSGNLHKLISQSSFHLKGTGWYVTDYADKPKTTSSSSDKTDKTSSSSDKTDKKESIKPAETSDTSKKSE